MSPLRATIPEERSSTIQLRAERRDDDECPDTGERPTVPPPGALPRASALDEVVFRLACGDFEAALEASDALMERVPVLVMARASLRWEPLGYWELVLVSRVDGEATLSELIDAAELPLAEAVRVICELVERQIVALR